MSTNEKGEMLEPCEERVTMFDERGKVGKFFVGISLVVILFGSMHCLCSLTSESEEVE